MWLKLILGTLFVLSLVCAFVVEPANKHELKRESNSDSRSENANRLRLLTWNIGNGDLESKLAPTQKICLPWLRSYWTTTLTPSRFRS